MGFKTWGTRMKAAMLLAFFAAEWGFGARPAVAGGAERIYRSAHLLGRGDAGIAAPNDQEAMFYNPAALASGKGIYKRTYLASPLIEASSSAKDLVREVAIEQKTDVSTLRSYIGRNLHFGVNNFSGFIMRRAAVGVVGSGQMNVIVKKSPLASGLEEASADSTVYRAAGFSLAESFLDQSFMFGGTFKYVMRDHAELAVNVIDAQNMNDQLNEENILSSSTGVGGDLGMIFQFSNKTPLTLGVQVENVGSTYMKTEKGVKAPNLPQIVNIGLAAAPSTKHASLGLYLDYRDATGKAETNNLKKIHIGAELNVKEFIGVCGGFNQGYPTFGLYFDIRLIRLDVGTYTEEMGSHLGARPDQRYYFALAAGF
jgi:hypothetical protein